MGHCGCRPGAALPGGAVLRVRSGSPFYCTACSPGCCPPRVWWRMTTLEEPVMGERNKWTFSLSHGQCLCLFKHCYISHVFSHPLDRAQEGLDFLINQRLYCSKHLQYNNQLKSSDCIETVNVSHVKRSFDCKSLFPSRGRPVAMFYINKCWSTTFKLKYKFSLQLNVLLRVTLCTTDALHHLGDFNTECYLRLTWHFSGDSVYSHASYFITGFV